MKETGKERFEKLEMKKLLNFELENEISLPQDYRRFLIEYNGGKPVNTTVPSINTEIMVVWDSRWTCLG